MSLLTGFEQRLERAVDGFFARVFRSGVHPVEIGRRLMRVMEDGKAVALRRTYVPNVYRIHLSRKDYDRLAPLEPRLVEELEVFISEAARQREWVLADSPRVSFLSDAGLQPGEFKVEGETVALGDSRERDRGDISPRREPLGRPSLIVLVDDEAVKTVPIDGRVRIGRLADNDLVIPDPGVSRHHAEVVEDGGRYLIRDLGSTNGTLVNGSPVTTHRLQDGDRIAFGRSVVEFRRA